MCGDEMMALNPSNKIFCSELTDWALQQSGVLRSKSLRHYKVGTAPAETNPENYNLEEHVVFEIEIEQMTKGQWHPYVADDVQLEFVMLEPYYRVLLKSTEPGIYSAQFRVP